MTAVVDAGRHLVPIVEKRLGELQACFLEAEAAVGVPVAAPGEEDREEVGGRVVTGRRNAAAEGGGRGRRLAPVHREVGGEQPYGAEARGVDPRPVDAVLVLEPGHERIQPLLEEWAEAEEGVREEADAVQGAVRVSALPILAPALALVARRLTVGRVGLVGSPEYLRRRGTPQAPADLAGHDLLRGHNPRSEPRTGWPLRAGGRIRIGGGFVTNDYVLLRGGPEGAGR